jgi:hypothetical protein
MNEATDEESTSRYDATEINRIEEGAMYSAQAQFGQAKRWRRLNFVLGVSSSVFAAVSGATALAATTGRITASILALAAAALGAILIKIYSAQRTSQAAMVATGYLIKAKWGRA